MVTEDIPEIPTTLSNSGLSSTNSITNLALSSMFWKPTFMAESDWLEHIPFAFWLIEAHKPATILEIGTMTGVSYFAMCQAVDRLHLDSSCFAIGQWNESASINNPDDSSFKALHLHNRTHYSSFSNLLPNSRTQALQYFDDGSIDLIHIKGLKGDDADRQLTDSWIQKLSENGLLLLHGTNIREADTQLYRFFSDLKQTYPGFEFRQSKGLGVLGVGRHQSDLINVLFSDIDNRGKNQVVQDVFSRLGRACADGYATRVNDEYIGELATESHLLKTRLESAERNLQQARQSLEANRREMKDFEIRNSQRVEIQALERGQLIERCSMIQEMYDQLNQHATELQDALQLNRNQLVAKEKGLAELSRATVDKDEQLTTAIRERDQLKLAATAKDKQTSELETKLTESKRLLADLQARNMDSETRLEALQSEIADLKQTITEKSSEIEQSKIEREMLTAEFAEKLTNLETKFQIKQSENAMSEQKIKVLQQSLDERYTEIAELVKLAETKEHEYYTQLEAERSRTNADNPERDRLVADLQARLKERENSLAERFNEIAKLTNLLELLERKSKIKASSLSPEDQNAEKSLATIQASLNENRKVGLRTIATAGKHIRLVEQSGLFDATWYLTQYMDVNANKKARKNPARHYVLYGGFEARDPSERFNSSWYLQQNPDVMKQGINPLVHYLLHGKNEGRLPKPSSF